MQRLRRLSRKTSLPFTAAQHSVRRLTIDITIRTVLISEFVVTIIAFGAATISESEWLLYVASFAGTAFLLHVPLYILKDPAFRIYQEHATSIYKLYWFFVIFVAAYIAGFMKDLLVPYVP